jgi:hypothetical protein
VPLVCEIRTRESCRPSEVEYRPAVTAPAALANELLHRGRNVIVKTGQNLRVSKLFFNVVAVRPSGRSCASNKRFLFNPLPQTIDSGTGLLRGKCTTQGAKSPFNEVLQVRR